MPLARSGFISCASSCLSGSRLTCRFHRTCSKDKHGTRSAAWQPNSAIIKTTHRGAPDSQHTSDGSGESQTAGRRPEVGVAVAPSAKSFSEAHTHMGALMSLSTCSSNETGHEPRQASTAAHWNIWCALHVDPAEKLDAYSIRVDRVVRVVVVQLYNALREGLR